MGNMTYQVIVTAYQDEHHTDSDKDAITVFWGDNTSSAVTRTNGGGNGILLTSDIRKSVFTGTHQYSKEGNYKIFISESYRHASILNIANGESFVTKLYVDALVPVYNDPTICPNNSVEFQLDPIFYANKNLAYSCNMGAYDADGDSLTYEVIECRGINGVKATNYYVPSGTSIDALGTLNWTVPFTGDYAFCVLVTEFRDGKKIGTTTNDFIVSSKSNFSVNPVFTGATTHSLNPGDHLNYKIDVAYPSATALSYTFWNNTFGGVTQQKKVAATAVNDTIDWNTAVSDGKRGPYIFVHRVQNIVSGKIFQKDYSVAVHVNGELPVNCNVPDMSEIEAVAPELFDYSIAPTVFEESVWVNVGGIATASVLLYDIQGKLIEKYTNFTTKTVQLDLSHLASAIYIFVLYGNEEAIIIQRIIKK